MGYLTTVTFYNDEAHLIEEYPNEFAKIISEAICGVPNDRRTHHRVCGNTIFHPPKHADDFAMYLHIGNCTIDVANIGEMDRIAHEFPDFFSSIIKRVNMHLKTLKSIKKECDGSTK